MDDHHGSFDEMGVALDGRLGASATWARGDAARLTQIVSNLLGNALKFTPRGGRVVVSLHRQEDTCILEVSDTGAGLAPEFLERVFDAFEQAPQTLDRAGGGLGLGLAMVKALVELHGGTVCILSPGLGHGTRVIVRLPLAAEPARAGSEPPQPALHQAQRVLVIEDNVDAAETLAAALALDGHVVRVAHDGQTGLAQAEHFQPGVVLCDIGLPGMDGYEVARALRSDEASRGILLLALSGYAQPEDLRRARAAGFDAHLVKPASLGELQRLISGAERLSKDAARATGGKGPS